MKKMTISKKFTIGTILVTVVMFIMGYVVLNYYKNRLTQEVYIDVKNDLKQLASMGIEAKDRKSTRLNSSHLKLSRMPSSA